MNRPKKPLYSFVKNILLKDWDPIGVGDLPEAVDEYNMYVPDLCLILRTSPTVEKIYKHLRWIEVDRMGMDGDKNHTRKIAEKLVKFMEDKLSCKLI